MNFIRLASVYLKVLRLGSLTLSVILSPLLLFSQKNDLNQYSVEDGLAQSQVFAMIEDTRGYLWLGTQGGGLSRFDGIDFQTYNTRDGLLSNYISSLMYDHEDILWIGTNVGLSRFDGREFRSYMGEGEEPLEVRALLQYEDSLLWLGTNQGIFQFEEDKLLPLNPKLSRLDVQCLQQEADGRVWVGHRGGLISFTDTDTLIYDSRHGLPGTAVRDRVQDSMGNTWIATLGDGLYQMVEDRFIPVSVMDFPQDMLIWDLHLVPEGRLWMGTLKQGAIAWNYKDSSYLQLDDQNGLPKNHVHTISQDEWGSIWLGTSGGGVCRYSGQEFVHYGRESELEGQSVYALSMGRDSSLWFSQGNHGLGRFDGKNFVFYDESNGFMDLTIRSLYTDRRGNIWAGTDGEGIIIIRDFLYEQIGQDQGLESQWVRDFIEDKDGYIWVATTGGIARITAYQDQPNEWKYQIKTFDIDDGLPSNRVNCLHLDMAGRIWYGLDGQGIGFIEKDSLVRRVPLEESRSRKIIRCMEEDSHGKLWVGTGAGVSRLSIYEPLGVPDWVHYSDKLTSTNVYLLAIDDDNALWIGSERGLDQAKLDDKQYIIDVRHYGITEGFLGVETCRNAVVKDHNGHYWFGTISGMTRYNPRRNVKNSIPPRLSITGIRLFYTPLHQTQFGKWVGPRSHLKPGLRLPHNRNHLSFEFMGINYPNPEQVSYQWMLKDLENVWSPPSFKRDATYSNIPPGDYTFMVRAANEEDLWSEALELSFSVKLPYWEEWWFKAGVLLFLVSSIFLILRIRINRVRKASQQEREHLIMEKSLIELEQKALRLQMNPHFIFHALNSINGLITRKDSQTARYYLSKFSHLMRQVLENSRESFISLQSEIATLENYLALEKFSRDDQFDFNIRVDEALDPEEILIPPMIVQPFVENAIIHGVRHLDDRCGKVSVSFVLEKQHLLCTIEDNGIGRGEAEKYKSHHQQNKKSTALLVTQERLDLLVNEEQSEPSIKIADLVDSKGKACGTRVEILIPLQRL